MPQGHPGRQEMRKTTISRVPSDLAAVNLREPWEIKFWCNHFNCDEAELRAAMAAAGSVVTEEIGIHLKRARSRRNGDG